MNFLPPRHASPMVADDPAAKSEAEALAQKMRAEFQAFENGLLHQTVEASMFTDALRMYAIFPHPATKGGLPVAWNIRWRVDHLAAADTKHGSLEVFLIERETGGWGLVFHSPHSLYGRHAEQIPTSTLWMNTAPTLAGLYAHAVAMADANLDIGGPEADIRKFVLSRYDMTDEAEAAEATLVGLGARVTTLPRALAE